MYIMVREGIVELQQHRGDGPGGATRQPRAKQPGGRFKQKI